MARRDLRLTKLSAWIDGLVEEIRPRTPKIGELHTAIHSVALDVEEDAKRNEERLDALQNRLEELEERIDELEDQIDDDDDDFYALVDELLRAEPATAPEKKKSKR